jgi:hypothetical protein
MKAQPHKFGHYLGYDKLTEVHGDWIKKAWTTEGDWVLQAHRNSYKTTSVLVVGFIWYMFYNPDKTVLIVRKEYEGAASIVREIAKHYVSEPVLGLYKYVYGIDNPLSMVRKDKIELSTKKKVTKEANLETIGIGGAITGRHYDKVFTDDIITIKDRISRAERENTKLFIQELENIPVAGGTKTHTGTPWHHDDGFTLMPEAEKYPVGSLEIKDLTPEYLAKIKRSMSPSLYAANYDLKHISDETREFDEPAREPWPERRFKIITAWLDPSYKGSNTTALAMYGSCNDRHYVRGWVWPESVEACYSKITNILTDYNAGTLYVETNADKGFSARDLRLKWPAVVDRNETMNKHIKIISHLKKNWCDIIFADDCQDEFLNQILDYQEGQEPDDAPDALAALLREMKIYDSDEILHRRFGI